MRYAPNIYRIQRWRRMAGVSLEPFAPLPRRQPRYRSYYRLFIKIKTELQRQER